MICIYFILHDLYLSERKHIYIYIYTVQIIRLNESYEQHL